MDAAAGATRGGEGERVQAGDGGGEAVPGRGGGADEQRVRELSEQLERAERESGLFADIVSHDLLNPVWVAENYLRLAAAEPDPGRAGELLEGARAAIEKTRGILLDARTFLRLRGTRALRRERVGAAALLASAAQPLRPAWEARRQRVTLEAPPGMELEVSPLFADVVANLLSNAVKHAPPDSDIAVTLLPGPPVRLEVRDRGPGVPPEAREAIFGRFERIEKGAIGGVGLGLAIARRVVGLHGGRLWVEDNPGGGAAFVAELPG